MALLALPIVSMDFLICSNYFFCGMKEHGVREGSGFTVSLN